MAKSRKANLSTAKKAKNDEFYTQYTDINNELCHYVKHFKGKTVLCNCDDPEQSHFWKFFVQNFEAYHLKKVISTHYNKDGSPSYKLEYTGETMNGQQVWVKSDLISKNGEPSNGDFRSAACVEILDECDIVVTNPPFSLFRPFVSQLLEYGKDFIIIGNKNAITYKEFFPLLKNNKVWIGYTSPNEFILPDGTITKQVNGLTRWFTNLDVKKRHELLLKPEEAHYKYHGHEQDYPKYDNYDAINVDETAAIPDDYDGVMGVPITFMDKYNPDEFEIVGLAPERLSEGESSLQIKRYKDAIQHNDPKKVKEGKKKPTEPGGKVNDGPAILWETQPAKYPYYTCSDLPGKFLQVLYARVLIRRKELK